MKKITDGELLFSSFAAANIYRVRKLYAEFKTGRVYQVSHCMDQTPYIAVCHDYYDAKAKDWSGRRFRLLSQLFERTYGGSYMGNDYIEPVDYIYQESDRPEEVKNTLILIYPEYEKYDLVALEDLLTGENTASYMIRFLTAVQKLHEQGRAAGGFNRNHILINKADQSIKLVTGSNLLSAVTNEKGKKQYESVGSFSLSSKGVFHEKFLGIPKQCCWNGLELADYAVCADIYSVVTLGFMGLTGLHPFQGALCDGMELDEIRAEIYQDNPVFIFDSQNQNNKIGLLKQEQDAITRWNQLPESLKQLYQELYTFPEWKINEVQSKIEQMKCFKEENWLKAFQEAEKVNSGR